MDRYLDSYVVFDLETIADRADLREHEIVEIGAILAAEDRVLDRFSTLVSHQRAMTDQSRQLTGIAESDLLRAPSLEQALNAFYQFVGNRPLIAHNGFGYDFPLLDAASSRVGIDPPSTLRLDTLELAHVVFPRAGKGMVRSSDGTVPLSGRGLDDLAGFFLNERPRPFHRALDDALLTHRILVRMIERLDRNEPVYRLQRWILGAGGHPWAKLLQSHREPVQLEDVIPLPPNCRRPPPTGRFDIPALRQMFEHGGALMQKAREPRRQQMDMAESCAETLSGEGGSALDRGLLIEAPTGTGKTLAYLAPAIEYARASGQTVIVAPHSKVLQNQIMTTLEELQEDLDVFQYLLLKGKNSYISLESLAAELDSLEHLTSDTLEHKVSPHPSLALALAVLCGWVAVTPTGDWDDLRTWAVEAHVPELRRFRMLLRVEETLGASNHPLEQLDFHRRAREGVANADVAILNHALLVLKEDWPDPPKFLIVDEAHNLEDSATSALTEKINDDWLLTLCSALWDPVSRRGTAQRLAAAAGDSLRSESIQRLRQASRAARRAVDAFSRPLVDFLRNRTGALQEEASRYPMSYRIRPGIDTRRVDYQPVLEAGSELIRALREIAAALNEITIPQELRGRYRQRRLEAEIARLGRQASEAGQLIRQVLGAWDPESWISIGQVRFAAEQWCWTLRRAPVTVDNHLRGLWQSLTAFVLTSATLSVGNSFDHIIRILGLDAVRTESLDSPFARIGENHLVLLTDYLPSPRHRSIEEFRNTTAAEIPRLFTLTGGRGMTLMTARARMEFVRDHARPILEAEGLPLLVQGDAPLPSLLERMRTERTTSLLALRSFWEGVDIPGEALSLLAIEKVPFDSPADPIVGTRMEIMERRGMDPFADYIVPRAALRFAQGVGRLIRTADDRGVTVVLDNRLRRPTPYRDHILRSLPGPPTFKQADSPELAYEEIADHLVDVVFDESMRDRLFSIPSADPWADLTDLSLTREDLSDEAVIRERLEQVRHRFGFEKWRPGQMETMLRFMQGRDVLAVLPTGSGKSITYQIPALLCPGVTLVISPLTALMNDQTEHLRSRRITQVATIHSGVSQGEQAEILLGAGSGLYKLLYISPERLWSPSFIYQAQQIEWARVAVDEAHCISQWGHSFRTEYAAIPHALAQLVSCRPPILATTATATQRVRQEIIELLQLDLLSCPVVQSPDRPEIRYYVERCKDFRNRDLRVVQIVESFRHASSIIYVPTQRDSLRLASLLRSSGHVVRPYHGGMEKPERQHVEDAFRHGEINVVVATKAFGMGIDKPDIALILHLEMPASIEEYIQETGRVARGAQDGVGPETGAAVLLVTPRDCRIHQFFAKSAAVDVETVRTLWSNLVVGMNPFDPERFSKSQQDREPDRQVLALAVSYLEKQGVLRRRPDIIHQGRINTVADTPQMIERLEDDRPDLAGRARAILRTLDQIGSEEYHSETWQEHLGRDPAQIETDLFELRQRDVLGFSAWGYAWMLERFAEVEPNWKEVERLVEERRSVIEEMSRKARHWSRDHYACRRAALLKYLGVKVPSTCGGCDACTPDLPRPWADSEINDERLAASIPAQDIILQLVRDMEGRNISRSNMVLALAGTTRGFSIPRSLLEHPTYGQLSYLGKKKTGDTIDSLVERRKLIEKQAEFNGTAYATLVPADSASTGRWPS